MSLPGLRAMFCLSLVTAVATASLVAGCGGGGAESSTAIHNTTVSKGQALIDLKNARDSGAISEAEYQRERKKILDAQ
ncbi:MAG TPA: SHOCT domain-containing protein [Alphaproteobacteria bacterium]|nr:SHOCT domain-containing protein [Alphaproteobacteria bacterium]